MIEGKLTVQDKATPPLPFWEGQKTVDLRLELSDGTVAIMQMSKNFARAIAKQLLIKCDQ